MPHFKSRVIQRGLRPSWIHPRVIWRAFDVHVPGENSVLRIRVHIFTHPTESKQCAATVTTFSPCKITFTSLKLLVFLVSRYLH